MTIAPLAFAKQAVKQPQQLWLRKVFFQIHLWAGLLLALYVVAIAISGSILVFKDELMPRPRVAGVEYHAGSCTPQGLLDAMSAAAHAHTEMVASLASCPTKANPLYAITLHGNPAGPVQSLTVYVRPQSHEAVGQVDENASWIGVVEKFHVDLLLPHNGRLWNGGGAAILLTIVLSGLFLWWPGIRNWRRALRVDFRRTWKRINWDLHSAAGIWTLFFTFTWALTGIYFAWPKPFEKVIQFVSPVTTARYPAEEMKRITQRVDRSSPQAVDLQQVLKAAETLSPGNDLEGMYFGTGTNAVLTVYMARSDVGDYAKTDFIYFDQQTGQHLFTWHRGQNKTLGDWLLWLLVPLHFGTSWGMPGKTAWCALGLVLPLLVITGFLMYWNRWLRKTLLN